jgi:tRNA 5-methylaminomethyl-2-thiouridine biosynthesis bifunctional protein
MTDAPLSSDSNHEHARLFASHDMARRWRDRRVFTFVDAHFDAARFLALWQHWRDDDARCDRLHVVAIADASALGSPPDPGTHPLAAELAHAWPMRIGGLHRLDFDAGRVVLTLAIGDARDMLPTLWARADAIHVGPSMLDDDPKRIARALARLAGDDATVTADDSAPLRAALKAAGFECPPAAPKAMLVARFAPRWRVRRHEPPRASEAARDASAREAIVIGAGLAGCAVTARLASRGWRITLIDRHALPARAASGNPAGVFHPVVWRDESIATRLTRAGFFHALRDWRALEAARHELHRSRDGLLQIADSNDDAREIARAIEAFGYPRDYIVPVSSDEATRIAGVRVTGDGWFFPHGGAISPAAICRAQLAEADAADRLRLLMNTEVARIAHDGKHWHAFDATGRELADAPILVLANAHDAARLAQVSGDPTRGVRGQLSLLDASPLDALRVPVIGEGYAVPLGAHASLIGATYDIDSTDREIRAAGHRENIERVARMLPDIASFDGVALERGRVAFRCVTSDRMPMIGQLADEALARRDARQLSGAWPLDLPRSAGLFGAFAFGSRGLTWATLAAELIASQIEGEPLPIERDLADAVDPARFLLRALRHGELSNGPCG